MSRSGGRSDNSPKIARETHRLDSAVDGLVAEWISVIPDLDRDVRAIAARIARLSDRLRAGTAAALRRSGLSDNEFRLLAGLLRSGPPFRLPPTELAGRYVPVTSGGLTGLVNRLEHRGLVQRAAHPRDLRSALIELTDSGKALALSAMQEFARREGSLMAFMSPADRQRGNNFLRKLLHSIEAASQ